MAAPQIIIIALAVISLILSSIVDGMDRTGKHRFSATFISVSINQTLLIWGGFYN